MKHVFSCYFKTPFGRSATNCFPLLIAIFISGFLYPPAPSQAHIVSKGASLNAGLNIGFFSNDTLIEILESDLSDPESVRSRSKPNIIEELTMGNSDAEPYRISTTDWSASVEASFEETGKYPEWNYYFIIRALINEYELDFFRPNRIRKKNGVVWAVATGWTEDYDILAGEGGYYHFLLKMEDDEWEIEHITDLHGALPDITGQSQPLYVSSQGHIWYAFGPTIYRYEDGNVEVFTTENSSIPVIEEIDQRNQIADLIEDDHGNFYAITFDARLVALEDGEWKLYDESNSVLTLHLHGIPMNADRMLATAGEDLWIANAHEDYGLVRKRGDEWSEFTSDNSDLPGNRVTSVIAKSDDHVFVGTWPDEEDVMSGAENPGSGGLAEIRNDEWTIHTVENGLPENSGNKVWVRAIEQGEDLWITYSDESFEQGLAVYDQEQEWHVIYKSESFFDSDKTNWAMIHSMTAGENDKKWLTGQFNHPVYGISQYVTHLDEAFVEFVDAPQEGHGYDLGEEFTLTWNSGRRIEWVFLDFSYHEHDWISVLRTDLLDAHSDEGYTYTFPEEIVIDRAMYEKFSIRISAYLRPELADTAGFFSVIDRDAIQYHLRKEFPNNSVELYEPSIHSWNIRNRGNLMWPEEDWSGIEYSFPLSTFPISGVPHDFPSWNHMRKAFGQSELEGTIGYRARALVTWRVLKHNGFQGVCHGFAVTSLLGFSDGIDGLSTLGVNTDEENLFDVELSPDVRSAINKIWVRQWGTDHFVGQFLNALSTSALENLLDGDFTLGDLVDLDTYFKGPTDALDDIKNMLERSSPGDYHNHLVIISPDQISSAHTILAYKAEQDDENPDFWRVYVYDSNYPGNDTLHVSIDTANDDWWYSTPHPDPEKAGQGETETNYQGSAGLFLGDRVSAYKTQSRLKEQPGHRSPVVSGEHQSNPTSPKSGEQVGNPASSKSGEQGGSPASS